MWAGKCAGKWVRNLLNPDTNFNKEKIRLFRTHVGRKVCRRMGEESPESWYKF